MSRRKRSLECWYCGAVVPPDRVQLEPPTCRSHADLVQLDPAAGSLDRVAIDAPDAYGLVRGHARRQSAERGSPST